MKVKVGDVVNYHSVIGKEITSYDHTVMEVYPMPNCFGRECAKLSGKSGVVAVDALSRSIPALTEEMIEKSIRDGTASFHA